jgi:hypothetical protein
MLRCTGLYAEAKAEVGRFNVLDPTEGPKKTGVEGEGIWSEEARSD